ncbi:cadherin-like domain-containing protein, partial [Rhodobacter sp. Har01]|uniref:Ig-like domain-containing protein n=1 Tax=Rhodobacter sp. Har01 TaxID=2883999 RepID=UPI001D06BFB1
ANGTLTNLGNGSYTYTPTAGFSGSDSFTYTVSDGTLTDTATVAITVTPEQEPGGGPASDDFSAGVLDPVWRIEGPAGVSSALGTSAQDAWLALVTPDGTYDAWNTNTAARAMQTTADDDFQLEARFLSLP